MILQIFCLNGNNKLTKMPYFDNWHYQNKISNCLFYAFRNIKITLHFVQFCKGGGQILHN